MFSLTNLIVFCNYKQISMAGKHSKKVGMEAK